MSCKHLNIVITSTYVEDGVHGIGYGRSIVNTNEMWCQDCSTNIPIQDILRTYGILLKELLKDLNE